MVYRKESSNHEILHSFFSELFEVGMYTTCAASLVLTISSKLWKHSQIMLYTDHTVWTRLVPCCGCIGSIITFFTLITVMVSRKECSNHEILFSFISELLEEGMYMVYATPLWLVLHVYCVVRSGQGTHIAHAPLGLERQRRKLL